MKRFIPMVYPGTGYFHSMDMFLFWVKCYRERERFDAEEIIPFLHQGRP